MKSLSTKRSATEEILLKIKEENKNQIAEKITSALRSETLSKYKDVRVHRLKQMAEMNLIGMDESITKEKIRTT